MSLFIASINSGSNGNCYYIGTSEEAILVDAGISLRETEKRMSRLGLSMSLIKAIVVSHEHSDHITGIPGISKKYQLPVYITSATYRNSGIPIQEDLLRDFSTSQEISIGGFTITPFKKLHDAIDPHSFLVTAVGITIGVFTDIGFSCAEVIKYFNRCHAVFLESNYCDEMLEKGNYPWHLKQRIRGDKGHLSNIQARDLFLQHRGNGLSHLILSHLSRNNNSYESVNSTFDAVAGNTKIVIASRYKESEVFCIDALEIPVVPVTVKPVINKQLVQLSLF